MLREQGLKLVHEYKCVDNEINVFGRSKCRQVVAAAREVLPNTKGKPPLSTVDNVEFSISWKASIHVIAP
jgi:hypothetical protein